MRLMIRRSVGVLLIVLLAPAWAFAQKRGFVATDYYKEIVPSDVAIAPAGDLVAFTVSTVIEKENKRHREI
jgi:hypothetical protein